MIRPVSSAMESIRTIVVAINDSFEVVASSRVMDNLFCDLANFFNLVP